MASNLEKLQRYPGLKHVVGAVLAVWPEHEAYCEARFKDDPVGFLERSEDLAQLVLKLTGDDLATYCADYRWMCEQFLEEEVFFRREGSYRLSTFKEAYEQIYANADYMRRYIHGILISQFIWTPHARAFDHFRTDFLTRLPSGAQHLEVGPGHGLFLFFASQHPNVAEVVAWDVSQSSIAATRKAIATLGVTGKVTLTEQDVLVAPPEDGRFDSAIISEVLEHLEEPGKALGTLHRSLKPGGILFVNVPINSPAPDHIYLLRKPDEVNALVESAGFEVIDRLLLPVTGATLERALKRDLSISCVLIAKKPV